MPKMPETELRAMIAAQHAAALAAMNSSKLSNDRADAMSYYNGDMSKDMPTPPGRSGAVSMDVQDTIEGIMPQLMEIFAGTDEVVKFEPIGPEDVEAAEQETDYINHVFMNQNPGFLVLYSFIKDALLSKTGLVKVWWEEHEEEQRETYYDKTDDEYALIVSNPDIEVIEHSQRPMNEEQGESEQEIEGAEGMMGHNGGPMLHDVTVVMKKNYARAKVLGVPPEEFGIERGARNIRDCNYCFHKVVDRTESDLIAQGYDAKQVRTLPTYRAWSNSEETNRDTVEEGSSAGADEINRATRVVEVTEHYVRMDYEGNNNPCLYRVVTGGNQGEILIRDGKPDVMEFDAIPFAAMTPVIVTHRFHGKSLSDLVMDIQRIKTALIRGLLDNVYLANNPRVEVSESHASANTLDDLLVSRPGGVVRTKMPGGVNWQMIPTIGNHVYPLIEYQDMVKEQRTGVTKQGQGIDANALQNQSATAVNQAFTAAQARIRLIARIFAETGIRDLFWLLHGTIKKHAQQAAVARLRNNWVTVDPRSWKSRDDLTIHVGLGTGGRAQRIAELQLLAGLQKDAMVNGLTNLVTVENLYSTAKEITKALGIPNVESFFTNPKTQPPLQPKPDPKLIELQAKNEIEKTQAEADIATQKVKTEAEIALAERKAQLEEKLMVLQHQMKENEHRMSMAAAAMKHATQPAKVGEDGQPVQQDHSAIHAILASLTPPPSKGMRIVRDEQGRVSHAVPME